MTIAFGRAGALVARAVDAGRLPGAVLLVRRDGRTVCAKAFGRRRVDGEERLELHDLFPIASLTKPIVVTAMLKLCEGGRLTLDDPVAAHLPEFARPRVLVSYDGETGTAVDRPARTTMTIRHLLAHTAGIHHGFPELDSDMGTLYQRAGVAHDASISLEENVRRISTLPLAHDPGTAWLYGLSSEVVGRLVEVISGEPLDRYLRRSIFDPLGMSSTSFLVPPEHRRRCADRHVRGEDGCVRPLPSDANAAAHPSGGGGLWTTVADYARFAEALLDGGPPILAEESVAEMTRNQIGEGTALGFKYGLGLGLATAAAPGRTALPLGGFGWYGIFSTWFWAWPEERAAIYLFGNVLDPTMNLPLFADVVAAVGLRA